MPTSTTYGQNPESRFSYAAAASGKQKTTTATTTMAPAPVDGPADMASTVANGLSTTQSEQSPESITTKEIVEPTVSAPSLNGGAAKEEKEGSFAEEKQNGSEKQSEASSGQAEEAPKPKEFVPAPAPAVNIWKVRQEQAAKAKVNTASTPATSTPAVADSATVTTGTTAKPAKDLDSTKKKSSKSSGQSNWDHNKANGAEKNNSREQRDRKKAESTKEKAANGYSKEDTEVKPRTGRQSRAQAHSATHPPSIDDEKSWPTPSNAKEEPKKQQPREESREKPTTGSKSEKWEKLDVGPGIYTGVSPKATRGGRSGRGGSRGGYESSKGGQKYSTDGAAGSDSERGRASQGEKPSRGGHFGGRGGKRATSAGNGSNRKASHTHNSDSRKEETGAAQSIANGTADSGSITTTDNKPNGDKISQSSPKTNNEKSERQQVFGSAPILPVNSSGNPNFEPNPLRERNTNGGRGGYRGGRGNNHYNGAANGSHQGGSASASTQTYPGGYQPRNNFQIPRNQRAPNASYPRFSQMPIPTTYTMHSYPAQYDMSNGVPMMGAHMHTEQSFDSEYIKGRLIQQVDYYFCIDNLCKDVYLRKHMDSEGFVKLSFIATFARVKNLTQSYEQLKDAVLSSRVLEVATSANGEGIRRKGDWQPWVREPEDRDPSVVGTPGPWTILAERPATEIHQTFQTGPQMVNGYMNGYHGEHSNGHAPHVHGFNGGSWYPPQMQNQQAHIEKQNGLSAEVPSFTPRTSKVPKQSHQPDVYPDSALDALVIVSTGSGADLGQSRPTPNGFLNGEAPAPRYHPISNTDSDFAASSNSVVEDSNTSLGWIDPNAGEDTTIPIPAGAVHRKYLAFKTNVLEQRKANNKVAEMAILYRFWRHFLLCHFNRNTYREFRQYAMEDNRNGLQLGFDYYLGYLKYVHLAKQQPPLLVTSDLVDLSKDYESALEVLRSVYHDSMVPAVTKSQIEGRLDAATKEKLA